MPEQVFETSDQRAEIIEESLSIQKKEEDLIRRALNKHHGKRKDAAKDLGISERTLYRKIKEIEKDQDFSREDWREQLADAISNNQFIFQS